MMIRLILLGSLVGLVSFVVISYPDIKSSSVSPPSVLGQSHTRNHFTFSELPEIEVDYSTTIVMVGDMLFENDLEEAINRERYNPFFQFNEVFENADLVIGNLETTIDGDSVGNRQNKPYTFSAPKVVAELISEAGFNAVSYANNHTKDFGAESVVHTINLLDENGVESFGAGSNTSEAFAPYIYTNKHASIAFLAINEAEAIFNSAGSNSAGTAYFNEALISAAINSAKNNADLVFVWTHWGTEHETSPNSFQTNWGRKIIDMGADMVIGAHPHVRQGQETYNGKYIFYSLGNFVFPGMAWSDEAQIGSVLTVTLDKDQIVSAELRDTIMDYNGVPRFK